MMRQQIAETMAYSVPNACGTCLYYQPGSSDYQDKCTAFTYHPKVVRFHGDYCNNGLAWRPSPKALHQISGAVSAAKGGFFSRLAEALLDRISGRYRLREIEQTKLIEPPQKSTVVKIGDGATPKKAKGGAA
jgi:hypothetical protein